MQRVAQVSVVIAVVALIGLAALVASGEAAGKPPCSWSHGIPYHGPNGSVLYTPAPPSPTIDCPAYR